jgi:hypothetical protein
VVQRWPRTLGFCLPFRWRLSAVPDEAQTKQEEEGMADVPGPLGGELVLYQTEDGRTRIECRFEQATIWLTQALVAELFQVTVPNVNEHLRNLYDEGELAAESTIRKFRIVRREGTREVARVIEHYNLDAILAETDSGGGGALGSP